MADYLLTPPTFEEGFTLYDRPTSPLWRYMHSDQGMSLVKTSGTWSVARLGSYPDLSVLDAYYQGGHQYTIDEATAEDMIADGLGDYLTPIGGLDYADVVLADEPTLYWRLGDVGPTVVDASDHGFYTPYLEVYTPVPGLVAGDDTAVESATADTMARYNDTPDFIASAGLSIEFWYEGSSDQSALACESVAGSAASIILGFPTSDDVTAVFRTEEDVITNIFATASGTGWATGPHHFAAVADGTDLLLYVDGVEVATEACVGSFAVTSTGFGGIGVFDELAVYDHALTPERVLAHYEAGVA